MRLEWTRIMRVVLLGVAVCVSLCLGMGAARKPDRGLGSSLPGLPPGARRIFEAAPGEEKATVFSHLTYVNPHMVGASLEIREQYDFILTPALLVQEAVSDGVILTYPEE